MSRATQDKRREILRKIEPKMKPHGQGKLTNWRVTKAQDDDGFYIRATDEHGTDYPIAITRHGDEKDNAELIVQAMNCHDRLIAIVKHCQHFIETPGDFQSHEKLELLEDIEDLLKEAV